jgi:2-polyprenyl-3-methyl-5-hydroxy-6-metoxy-1,4-benzoquinol methylase
VWQTLITATSEMKRNSNQYFDDPVAAYSRLGPHFADLSSRREPYLRGIERRIVSRISNNAKALLDVGAGDGSRALRIASEAGIPDVVLVEPSKEMSAAVQGAAEVWNVRAEEMGDHRRIGRDGQARHFGVITCLWNVLGHVRGIENRVRAMRAMNDLLAPTGKCFLDVTYRYNLRSYGVFPTAARFLRDSVLYRDINTDVVASWNIGSESISTYGHVFADREIRQLARSAGLEVEERIVVDYDSGKIRRFAFAGNLLYVLRRRSIIDSASAPQTS